MNARRARTKPVPPVVKLFNSSLKKKVTQSETYVKMVLEESNILQCNSFFALQHGCWTEAGVWEDRSDMAGIDGFTRSDDVRKGNRRRVLAAIRRRPGQSRSEIAISTGLSPATVSAISNELIGEGLVKTDPGEPGPRIAAGGRGRPKVALAINPDYGIVVSVTFQFNYISAAAIDFSGTVRGSHSIETGTRECSAAALRQAIGDTIREALARSGLAGRARLLRIAAACQGTTNVEGTVLAWSPITPLKDIEIARWIEEDFGVPASAHNDCDLIARALNWRYPERYDENYAAILLAGGVGMGLVLRGNLINGTASSGTEFGHMVHMPGGDLCRCGRLGCIEAYAGDYAIERRARGLSGRAEPTAQLNAPDIAAIAQRARLGDRNAIAAAEAAGMALGYGLANMFTLVDPFPVALVGQGTIAFDLMEKPLREALSQAMTSGEASDIAIDCFPEERPLLQDGCAIHALECVDLEAAESGGADDALMQTAERRTTYRSGVHDAIA